MEQAEAKKLRAEKLLSKIELSMIPLRPSDDLETISEEERSVFRRIGLRMKAYLPLGKFLGKPCFLNISGVNLFLCIFLFPCRHSWCF